MEHFLWINKSTQRRVERLIREAIKRSDTKLFLETPPVFIMVSLTDRKTHKPRSKHALPKGFNVLQLESIDMVMILTVYWQEKMSCK